MLKRIANVKLGIILGAVGFMLSIGVLETPALADENVQAYTYRNITTSAANIGKDYSINASKSVEQNGFKVTVHKVIVTRHKLKATLKIESEKTFKNIISQIDKFKLGMKFKFLNKIQ